MAGKRNCGRGGFVTRPDTWTTAEKGEEKEPPKNTKAPKKLNEILKRSRASRT
jgi:hypothetical protein